MHSKKIAPSVMCAPLLNVESCLQELEASGADLLHIDVMDGSFVSNYTLGTDFIRQLKERAKLPLDIHLMINDPIRYINDFIKAGADLITFHLESCQDPRKVIREIREREIRCGIAISPATPVDLVLPYLEEVDMVLIMTVVPGFGGQAMIPSCLDKVRFLRRYADRRGLTIDIEVDGGIKEDNIALATEAGANVIVAGSAIFGSKKPRSVIEGMRKAAAEHPFRG